MDNVLAIIPARVGSKGIPHKNFREFRNLWASPLDLAVRCAEAAGLTEIYVTSDSEAKGLWLGYWLHAPAPLHQDDTAMIDVVKDVLARVPGAPDQQIVLLQPTQPLREPRHIQDALALLTPDVDSVVSVLELPQTHAAVNHAYLVDEGLFLMQPWATLAPTRRQACGRSFIRDGTAYAFHRRTVERFGNIYGENVRPLIIPASETCPLDSERDWLEAERRLHARQA